MAKIYLASSFQKEIGKQKNLLKELFREIKKYTHGGKNLIDIYSPGTDLRVLKAYLLRKKIRAAILLRVSKQIYIPFFLARKETKEGWNLSKYSEEYLYTKILRVQTDIEQGRYKEFDLSE